MQIAVCDDIKKELEKIRTALDIYTRTHHKCHIDIDEYQSADAILYAAEKGRTYDIALLDICMPGILGIEVAKEMLDRNPGMGIVFVTTSDEYAIEAFAMNATHYLLKPFSQEQFNEALDRAVGKVEEQDFLSLSCVDGIYRINVHEITFIESQGHYLMVCLSSGETLRLRMKLSQIFEDIKEYPEFIRVGISYIANLAFVRRIAGNTLEIMDNTNITIPKRNRKEVQKIYMDFCRKEALK